MSIFRKIDKVLGAFGNIKALERTHVDTYTENLMANISGEKIAESQYGQLWVAFQELGGYHFLNATILSASNIKTFKGCKLICSGAQGDLTLDSDITEIESDYSNVSNRWMTKISFVVTKEHIAYFKQKKANDIKLKYKKKAIPFKVIK